MNNMRAIMEQVKICENSNEEIISVLENAKRLIELPGMGVSIPQDEASECFIQLGEVIAKLRGINQIEQ